MFKMLKHSHYFPLIFGMFSEIQIKVSTQKSDLLELNQRPMGSRVIEYIPITAHRSN